MPRKSSKNDYLKRASKRAREAEKRIPFLVLLTCEETSVAEMMTELSDRPMARYAYEFPLNGKQAEFERNAKNMATHLYIHLEKMELSKEEKESWRFKIRMIKASNEELKIFCNKKADEIMPPQAMRKVVEKKEVKKIFQT